ncbi:Phosphoglycolate/pyridoxal phosphate phosphatase family protein [Aphelenchoides besseyi]|nr:Phosphoglycolate/pyridoxal phosphate phosphatase family protein [Aphelenchoides besseyi]KAI6199925.1 Phosphoglycolate/pyridoxal phosphate phosphatase family protein [Aphelenchoides besseyi]
MPPIELNVDCSLNENMFLRRVDNGKTLKTPPLPTFLDSEKFRPLMDKFTTFVFDCDGVLWLGQNKIEGSPQFIDMLLDAGKQVILLTNNATCSRATYGKKLAKLGYSDRLGKHSLVNPSAVTADVLYRKGMHKTGKKVYVIGEQGVKDELDEVGVPHFSHDTSDKQKPNGGAFLLSLDLDEEVEQVGAVVVGYQFDFNYLSLMKACNYLQNENVDFIGTNEDDRCPAPDPELIVPDAGPIISAVKAASGREPMVVGKPNTPAFDYIQRRWKIDPARTLMVGDRTDTDIKFGRDHGLQTMLVLSGCHQVEDVVANQMNGSTDKIPHYYANNLGSLVPNDSN